MFSLCVAHTSLVQPTPPHPIPFQTKFLPSFVYLVSPALPWLWRLMDNIPFLNLYLTSLVHLPCRGPCTCAPDTPLHPGALSASGNSPIPNFPFLIVLLFFSPGTVFCYRFDSPTSPPNRCMISLAHELTWHLPAIANDWRNVNYAT